MANRTAATILREMQQAKNGPIPEELKQKIIADLTHELNTLYKPTTQLSLDLAREPEKTNTPSGKGAK